MGGWNRDNSIHLFLNLLVILKSNGQDVPHSRFNLGYITQHLFIHLIFRNNSHRRHFFIDESDWTVFHLPAWVALCMNIGYLLELEGSL